MDSIFAIDLKGANISQWSITKGRNLVNFLPFSGHILFHFFNEKMCGFIFVS